MPALYYVYRLAALHRIPHIEDLLAEYPNGNELDGWIAYFREEDERQLKRLKTAFSTASVPQTSPGRAPMVPARQEEPEPVIDMTDPKNQQSFLKFVTGGK
jgi:hypothetical protein